MRQPSSVAEEASPRSIAFVSLLETGRWGASEYLWSETALRLARAGHDVLACTHGWRDRPAPLAALMQEKIVLVERFPPCGARLRDFIGSLRNASGPAAIHERSIKAVIGHRPDIVLISCTWPTQFSILDWCECLRVAGIRYAVLVHTHAGHNWPSGPFAARLANALSGAAALYFVSEDNRALLVNQLGLPTTSTSVVRNPLAVDRETAPSWPADSTARLACVGRLDPAQKGQDILLECLHEPRWRDRHFTLNFFGEGPARSRLEAMSADLSPGMVLFHGHVQGAAEIWKDHHLLVFPSRFEGLGLVVAEAQLCGRPVVISDCAARELVVDGQTGFVARGCSASTLGDALERAWEARALWPAMGQAARQHMLELLPADPAGEFASKLLGLVKAGLSRHLACSTSR